MTKRKSLIVAIAFLLVLSFSLTLGISLCTGTLMAYAEDSTSSDSEIKTYKLYSTWGTIQADGQSSSFNGRAVAELDVRAGAIVTIIADEKSNAVFSKWKVSASFKVTLEDENSATTTFVMPKGDVWLDCEFKLIRTVTVENGTLEGGATSKKYTEGDTVKIIAQDKIG